MPVKKKRFPEKSGRTHFARPRKRENTASAKKETLSLICGNGTKKGRGHKVDSARSGPGRRCPSKGKATGLSSIENHPHKKGRNPERVGEYNGKEGAPGGFSFLGEQQRIGARSGTMPILSKNKSLLLGRTGTPKTKKSPEGTQLIPSSFQRHEKETLPA